MLTGFLGLLFLCQSYQPSPNSTSTSCQLVVTDVGHVSAASKVQIWSYTSSYLPWPPSEPIVTTVQHYECVNLSAGSIHTQLNASMQDHTSTLLNLRLSLSHTHAHCTNMCLLITVCFSIHYAWGTSRTTR